MKSTPDIATRRGSPVFATEVVAGLAGLTHCAPKTVRVRPSARQAQRLHRPRDRLATDSLVCRKAGSSLADLAKRSLEEVRWSRPFAVSERVLQLHDAGAELI
jgi:hypothetical protein